MTDLRDSPIFIAGHPKSGTSLLRSLLDSHPELVTYPEETSFFRRYLPDAQGKSLSEKLSLSDRTLTHIFEWNQANPPPHQAGYPDRDYAHIPADQVRQCVRQLVAECFAHDGDMLSAVILAYGQVTGQLTPLSRRWVEKTPYNEHYAAQVFAWWPAARMLHVLRDPRDNFASYRRKQPNWSPEAFALNWARSTQAGLENQARFGVERVHWLRYEDLVKNPQEETRRLVQFLDIRDDPALRELVRGGKPWAGNSMFADQFTHISAAPVGRWREALKPDEVAAIEVIAAPVMHQTGYAPTSRASLAEKPIRRRVIRRLVSLLRASPDPQARAWIGGAVQILARPSALAVEPDLSSQPYPAGDAALSHSRPPSALQLALRLAFLYSRTLFNP